MALSMARPFKHPDTGMYWLRKRVPDDLRAVLGKREVKQTLGTKNPAEAKRLHAAALAAIEAEWAALRRGAPVGLTEAVVAELEQAMHDRWLAHHTGSGKQTFWRTLEFERLWEPETNPFNVIPAFPVRIAADDYRGAGGDGRWDMKLFAYQCGDEFAVERGLTADVDDRLRLAKAASRGLQRASLAMKPALGWGDAAPGGGSPSAGPAGGIGGGRRTIGAGAGAGKPLPFSELVEGWARERKPAQKTAYMYPRVMDALKDFLGHDDARRLTADDLVAWKNDLISKDLSGKTIRDAKLAPVRAMLQWAVDNRLLADNVAERITISIKGTLNTRIRAYTDDEAKRVLTAARKAKDGARRWVPFVAAYTGARVAEICQLRGEDIKAIDGIPCMVFAAEAGSLKNANSERAVPLHPALITEGFLAFCAKTKDGPLFIDLDPDRFGSRGGNGSKVLSRWIRSIGIDDKRLSPNHSWRHRLKTLARRHGLASDIVDAITGHGRKSVAATYGHYEMTALLRELEKIPDVMAAKATTSEPSG
jgi:integrase